MTEARDTSPDTSGPDKTGTRVVGRGASNEQDEAHCSEGEAVLLSVCRKAAIPEDRPRQASEA